MTTSRPPICSRASSNSALVCASSAALATLPVIAPPVAALTVASSMSEIWTRAPVSTKPRAMAWPMPPAPAVIRTRRPFAGVNDPRMLMMLVSSLW